MLQRALWAAATLAATALGTEGGGDSHPPLSWGQAGMGGPAATAQDITQVPSLSGRGQPRPGSRVLRPAVVLRRQRSAVA